MSPTIAAPTTTRTKTRTTRTEGPRGRSVAPGARSGPARGQPEVRDEPAVVRAGRRLASARRHLPRCAWLREQVIDAAKRQERWPGRAERRTHVEPVTLERE